jgi:hypothetical protein
MALDREQSVALVRRIHLRLLEAPGETLDVEVVESVLAITLEELDPELALSRAAGDAVTLRVLSRVYAQLLLERHGRKSEVCRILGITDKTLNRILRGD